MMAISIKVNESALDAVLMAAYWEEYNPEDIRRLCVWNSLRAMFDLSALSVEFDGFWMADL